MKKQRSSTLSYRRFILFWLIVLLPAPLTAWAQLFLYMSYYGTDQSQVQRELSAGSVGEAKRALIFNGLCRFPLTLLYVLLGIAMYAVYVQSAELQASVPGDHLDYLVPQFVLLKLPAGLRAVLFAALLSAAMSSLDSALNSLSAATMRDFLDKRLDPSRIFLWSKLTTVAWGVVITGFAFFVGAISDTVVEGINKIGSAFYGPILAAFLVGVLSKKVNVPGILAGIVAGVGLNIVLWLGFPGIHWMWWNLIGCAVTTGVAFGVSGMIAGATGDTEAYTLSRAGIIERERPWLKSYVALAGYFVLMLVILLVIQGL